MKAIVCEKYGPPDVLELREVEKPAPRDNEVLVKICAASVNAYDWHCMTADMFPVRLMGGGLLKPKYRILGADIAGRVEAVGRNVTQFHAGDEVFGDIGHGGFAEYVCAPESRLARKPSKLSFEEAAAVPMAALTALQGLRNEGHVQPGEKVLIQGASGGVGTFAVQIAKAFGAHVTAVCSPRNIEQARMLGADLVIDYTREDFTLCDERYDSIFAANGYHPLAAYKRALAPNGVYVMAGGTLAQALQGMILGSSMSENGGRKMRSVTARMDPDDLATIGELIQAGKIRPVVERCYPLSEAAQALRYLGDGHARGKVIIAMEQNGGNLPVRTARG